ncbi:hypothetical protein ZWY2020_033818 [Hordeum vulgare]|nr:hypothetical protein ZWY2020_033818 [Hordeum vulgare]
MGGHGSWVEWPPTTTRSGEPAKPAGDQPGQRRAEPADTDEGESRASRVGAYTSRSEAWQGQAARGQSGTERGEGGAQRAVRRPERRAGATRSERQPTTARMCGRSVADVGDVGRKGAKLASLARVSGRIRCAGWRA